VADALGKSLRNLPGPVLITGHTGFKGTWMTLLLRQLGVSVIGYSLQAEKDSLYDRAKLKGQIPELFADIRNYEKLKKFISKHQPSVVIHMAAQPLVLESYRIPRETFDVNVMGTANLLDASFDKASVRVVLIVTTDKVYKNNENKRSFIESDPLEGKDPYSASKVGTESVVHAWQQISEISGGPIVVAVRAGNVIGGGDFAKERIFPDMIRSYISGNPVVIRNPESTRPWQHVVDPILGYTNLIERLLKGLKVKHVNFGPKKGEKPIRVEEICELAESLLGINFRTDNAKLDIDQIKKESVYLEVNSNLSLKLLHHENTLSQIQAIEQTLYWWKEVIIDKKDPALLIKEEIRSALARYKKKKR
jgi:CDP-glucose 4,6-dehydratase